MPTDNPFLNLTASQLDTLETNWLAALNAISTGQSYSIAGRTLTKVNATEAAKILGQIGAAKAVIGGTIKRVTYADMSNTPG